MSLWRQLGGGAGADAIRGEGQELSEPSEGQRQPTWLPRSGYGGRDLGWRARGQPESRF